MTDKPPGAYKVALYSRRQDSPRSKFIVTQD